MPNYSKYILVYISFFFRSKNKKAIVRVEGDNALDADLYQYKSEFFI